MDIWCVSSHHLVGPDPVEVKGVKLQPIDLDHAYFGVWNLVPGSVEQDDTTIKVAHGFMRSVNEASYLSALRVLFRLKVKAYVVVSLRWSANTPHGLIIPKRAWLAVYEDGTKRELLKISHAQGWRALYSFLEVLPEAEEASEAKWGEYFAILSATTRVIDSN